MGQGGAGSFAALRSAGVSHPRTPGEYLTKGKGGEILVKLERDGEKWLAVFLVNHATTKKLARDDVFIKHHPALEELPETLLVPANRILL